MPSLFTIFLYSQSVICLFMFILVGINRYASIFGKLIAGIGCILLALSSDTLLTAAVNGLVDGISPIVLEPEKPIVGLPLWLASLAFIVGVFSFYWGLVSWTFTRPEKIDERHAEGKKTREEEEARLQLNPCGQLLNIRTTVAKGGLLSSDERFTEIETSERVLVVTGEVGSVNKGVPVFVNGFGVVRVGAESSSPSFYLRT